MHVRQHADDSVAHLAIDEIGEGNECAALGFDHVEDLVLRRQRRGQPGLSKGTARG